jgi:hypothetical protein
LLNSSCFANLKSRLLRHLQSRSGQNFLFWQRNTTGGFRLKGLGKVMTLHDLLESETLRRVEMDGQTFYAACDVVSLLAEIESGQAQWDALKRAEAQLARLARRVEATSDRPTELEMLDLTGVLRLIQSIDSPRAARLKLWLAKAASQRLAEAQNPELAALRARRLYERHGYAPRWVDKRLRGVSARHELTAEWYKRGARESDQFRELTNVLMRGGFGMDVESYRRHKGLNRPTEQLRDHMSDLELALVSLGETAAVHLHRQRSSSGLENLRADACDAGEVVAQTRAALEAKLGRGVIERANHRDSWTKSRPAA